MNEVGEIAQRLFVKSMHLWTAIFLLYACFLGDMLWVDPVSPALSFPNGPIRWLVSLTKNAGSWFWRLTPIVAIFVALCSVLKRVHWVLSFFVWAFYVILIARGWMVSTGGQQLVAIMLFWCIPLSTASSGNSNMKQFAAWAARLQLLLAYLSTFLHKLQGDDWLQGNALSILASDPTFNFQLFESVPQLAALLTMAGLFFQLLFAVGIWIPKMRWVILLFGLLFHAGTAFGIEIPDMAMAFVLCYTIWLSPVMEKKVLQRFPRLASNL